jgi:hypothetical protein
MSFAGISRMIRSRRGVHGLLLALMLLCQPVTAAQPAERPYPGPAELQPREPEGNPHLQEALRFYDALEYEKALGALAEARQGPSNTPEEQVHIEMLEGFLSFELHQPERGKNAFRRALSVNPEAKPTLRVSPKVLQALEEARAELRAAREASPVVEAVPPRVVEAISPRTDTTDEAPGSGFGALSRFRLPIAIGGGVVTVGGVLAWTRARSLASRVRTADVSIKTRDQLESTLSQGRTFEKVGWGLMGLGIATTAGSLLLLDAPASGARASIIPTQGGAHLALTWGLP